RRNGMLALYLSTPLHRGTYLAAKALAVAGTLALVTIGPPLLVLAGYTFDGSGPDGVNGWLLVLVRILISGVAISAALMAVSMGASSVTDRKAFAAIGIILLVFASSAFAGALVDGAGASVYWRMVDLSTMPFELVFRIFGQAGNFPDLPTWAVIVANLAWTAAGLAVVVWRYLAMVIAR
ncbi:MAG: hypothetical protein AAFY28_11515, partial [Actinomycetota bacterium]